MAYDFLVPQGVIVADTSEVLNEVKNEINEAFQQVFTFENGSIESVLANFEAANRTGTANIIAKNANQINPNQSEGVFLDALFNLSEAITGGRREATFTQILGVDLSGVPSTIIPSGTLLATANNDQFETLTEVTLSGGGSATVNCQALILGPIQVDIGQLNTILPGAPIGLETVSNPNPAIPGLNKASDSEARIQRKQKLSSQNTALPLAIKAALLSIDGVKSQSFRENVENTTQIIDGLTLGPHSIYVHVDGGLESDIGKVLLANKTLGTGWNGTITQPTIDPTTGQLYNVQFDRPNEKQLFALVTIKMGSSTDPVGAVKQAIVNYANGLSEVGPGFIINEDTSPYELSAAINREQPEIKVTNLELSLDGINFSKDTIINGVNEVARINENQINVLQV